MYEAEDYELLGGFLVQSLKALHQVALDRGSWRLAKDLIPTPDPLVREDFGGDERELEAIHSYHKALKELRERGLSAAGSGSAEAEPKGELGGNAGG